MSCTEFEAALHAYMDGELSLQARREADSHATECRGCAELVQREREFRRLVRWQPRESAPVDLRTRIGSLLRATQRVRRWRPWLIPAGLAAGAIALVTVAGFLTLRPSASLVAELVAKHIAYAQIERPVELSSSDRADVEQWLRERTGLKVTVPDFTRAGIRLLGARLTDARDRVAAYLLYEKGRTLLSVFVVPIVASDVDAAQPAATYHGRPYIVRDVNGFRTVSWRAGSTLFALVSSLDHDALLACADSLRIAREYEDGLSGR